MCTARVVLFPNSFANIVWEETTDQFDKRYSEYSLVPRPHFSRLLIILSRCGVRRWHIANVVLLHGKNTSIKSYSVAVDKLAYSEYSVAANRSSPTHNITTTPKRLVHVPFSSMYSASESVRGPGFFVAVLRSSTKVQLL